MEQDIKNQIMMGILSEFYPIDYYNLNANWPEDDGYKFQYAFVFYGINGSNNCMGISLCDNGAQMWCPKRYYFECKGCPYLCGFNF